MINAAQQRANRNYRAGLKVRGAKRFEVTAESAFLLTEYQPAVLTAEGILGRQRTSLTN